MNLKLYYKKLKSIFELSFVLAKAEFKLRNEGSYLGIFWYLLSPILTFILLLLVFGDRLGGGIKEYPLYLLIGVVMFNLFQNATIESTKSIIKEHIWIIKSINFPRESLILSIVIKNIFSHFFEIIIIAFMLFLKANILTIVFYPIILLFFSFFIYGFSLILSSLTVYFVDLDNIWSFAARLLWLGTPIFYAIEGQVRLFYINLFNPVYYFLTAAREVLIYSKLPDFWIIAGCLLFSFSFFIFGTLIFSKLKIKFAEKI